MIYTKIEGPITFRFDGVLKGSNVIDDLGVAAWEALQELSNQGNKVANKIFSLHTSFFGRSTSGFFNTEKQSEVSIPANESQDASINLEFDQLNSIESIEGNHGSTIDARRAIEAVDVDLKANSFRTSFFGHTIETIVKGFTNVLGSQKNDNINGDDKNNVLLGLEMTQSMGKPVMIKYSQAMVMILSRKCW